MLNFTIHKQHNKSRLGTLTTKHGSIRTPAFMPVGTRGAVKAMLPESVEATGADIILGNTYHLMLKPGAEIVAKLEAIAEEARKDLGDDLQNRKGANNRPSGMLGQ